MPVKQVGLNFKPQAPTNKKHIKFKIKNKKLSRNSLPYQYGSRTPKQKCAFI